MKQVLSFLLHEKKFCSFFSIRSNSFVYWMKAKWSVFSWICCQKKFVSAPTLAKRCCHQLMKFSNSFPCRLGLATAHISRVRCVETLCWKLSEDDDQLVLGFVSQKIVGFGRRRHLWYSTPSPMQIAKTKVFLLHRVQLWGIVLMQLVQCAISMLICLRLCLKHISDITAHWT